MSTNCHDFGYERLIALLHATFQVFLPSIREMRPGEQAPHVLLHDNAPIHTARLVREWLETNADQVSILT